MRKIHRNSAAVGFCMLLAACMSPNALERHAADYNFCGEQFTTNTANASAVGVGGDVVYTKTITLPSDQRTIFVTLSSEGDGHGGASHWLSASVNGNVCNRGDSGAAGAPAGWVSLQKHRDSSPGGDGGGGIGDLHDNGIYYTWCCVAGVRPGGANAVEIRLASSIAGEYVFLERSHFYVDSVGVVMCTDIGCKPGAEFETLRSKMPPGHQKTVMPPPKEP